MEKFNIVLKQLDKTKFGDLTFNEWRTNQHRLGNLFYSGANVIEIANPTILEEENAPSRAFIEDWHLKCIKANYYFDIADVLRDYFASST